MSSPPAIRVRMYDVGFGDCFLVTFPCPGGERTVLIDCGVHAMSRGKHSMSSVLTDLFRTLRARTPASRVDVVVASHRHQDHVSGFVDQDRWAEISVGEVWLPWTEDPADSDARRIKDRQSKRARLLLRLAADKQKDDWQVVAALAENSNPRSYTNSVAMATLHEGFSGEPQRYFLPESAPGGRITRFTTPNLPGVTVHILGPSRDEADIRDMEPPANESYLALGKGRSIAVEERQSPFDHWRITQGDYAAKYPHLALKKNQIGTVVNAGNLDAMALAVSLEKAVNGTSLMLAFEFGDAVLLFPGDAQWGTWDRVLRDPEKSAVVDRATLLKVGHHGSHNATPRQFVEKTRDEAIRAALVSVGPTKVPNWKQIPRGPLLAALEARSTTVIRSDVRAELTSETQTELGYRAHRSGLWTEISVPVWSYPAAPSATPGEK